MIHDIPKILIIIVTWNKKSYVVNLLNSLKKIDYQQDALDIVVVDNASTDTTVPYLKENFPEVTLIENDENIGGTGGFNTGLSYAFSQPDDRYKYLWLLDNDVIVHPSTLSELVNILEEEKDVAIAGSTMMQLTAPHRINEMGAYVDMGRGTLILNRHLENVKGLQGKSIEDLQNEPVDLSTFLKKCKSSMDVEYVAAASLVIRAGVAKEAGLWDDFFIHYDDVEWCLRIAKMGFRIMVSAKSLIWHLPAEYKVPSWILYYDNRNVLYMLEKHAGQQSVLLTKKWIKKKSLYYYLLGKYDLAALHLKALEDYEQKQTGKKEIQLDPSYYSLQEINEIFKRLECKKILVPWTVDLQMIDIQKYLVKERLKNSDLQIFYLVPPPALEKELIRQIPHSYIIHAPKNKIKRLFLYLKLRNQFDLILQSDYKPLLPSNLLSKNIMYCNVEGVSLRKRPSIASIVGFVRKVFL